MKWSLGIGGALVVVLSLSGCSKSLPADDIEREIARQMSTQDFVPDVTCDEDLPGEAGATIECATTLSDGQQVEIVVTATEVSGDQVRYSFEVQGDSIDPR